MPEQRTEPYWAHLRIDMPDHPKIKIIEALPEADALLWLWVRMILHAVKINEGGWIYLNPTKPFTEEMLASIYHRPVNIIRLALKTFQELSMVDITDQGIYLINFNEHQNSEALSYFRELNRKRVARFRAKHRLMLPEKTQACDACVTLPVHYGNVQEKEKEKEKEEEEEEIWIKTLEELKNNVTQRNFETWLKDTKFFQNNDGTYYVMAKNDHIAEYLETNQRSLIERTLARILGRDNLTLGFAVLPKED